MIKLLFFVKLEFGQTKTYLKHIIVSEKEFDSQKKKIIIIIQLCRRFRSKQI